VPIKFLKDALVIHPWRRAGAFTTYKKQLASIQYYNKKHSINLAPNYLSNNVKSLLIYTWRDFKLLKKFSFKGYKYYIEMVYFYGLLIFKK